MSNVYKGYKLLSGTETDFNEYMSSFNADDWCMNEYLIFENTQTGKSTEMRFNGETFVSLKLPPSSYIKAKNALQRCALDMMFNKDITVCAVLGTYGSGKTFIALNMALYWVKDKCQYDRIIGIREAFGEGKQVGFLPGSLSDKTENFFAPLSDQLAGGQYALDGLISQGKLETVIPFYAKGRSFNDVIMCVDEAEDLSESQIKLLGTRIGQNGRIFFSGDYGQSLINKTESNPLVRMCNELRGNPLFACIYLEEDVRSETSRMFANLFLNS